MYSTYHFQSASEINSDIVDAIKMAFKGRPVRLTVEDEPDETTFLLSLSSNREMFARSFAQDQKGEYVKVNIPE